MGHQLAILAMNAALVGAVYGVIYPRLSPLTARRMMRTDAAMTAAALLAAGLLYAGRGVDFGLGAVSLPWWAFSLLTLLAIEAPVFWAFVRARGISWRDPDAPTRPPRK